MLALVAVYKTRCQGQDFFPSIISLFYCLNPSLHAGWWLTKMQKQTFYVCIYNTEMKKNVLSCKVFQALPSLLEVLWPLMGSEVVWENRPPPLEQELNN